MRGKELVLKERKERNERCKDEQNVASSYHKLLAHNGETYMNRTHFLRISLL